ncbi:hypothetical protein BM43_7481 (plasmid) [Burkholderia gladioli]|nr:hypothetical protein BM43_7481 [Burkholderia gladioli]
MFRSEASKRGGKVKAVCVRPRLGQSAMRRVPGQTRMTEMP